MTHLPWCQSRTLERRRCCEWLYGEDLMRHRTPVRPWCFHCIRSMSDRGTGIGARKRSLQCKCKSCLADAQTCIQDLIERVGLSPFTEAKPVSTLQDFHLIGLGSLFFPPDQRIAVHDSAPLCQDDEQQYDGSSKPASPSLQVLAVN